MGKADAERNSECLKIIEIPDWVKLKALSAWPLASDAHPEMLESQENVVVIFRDVSRKGFTPMSRIFLCMYNLVQICCLLFCPFLLLK